MATLRLDIAADTYALWLGDDLIGRLDGGAGALLSGVVDHLRELDIEIAIERAEEWLMPMTSRMRAFELVVDDATGRLAPLLGEQQDFAPSQFEDIFNWAHGAVVRGTAIEPGAVADVVLLRELAHHGRLARIRLACI